MKEKLKVLGRILVFIACIGIMLFGVLFLLNTDQWENRNLTQIANPLTEVKNAEEMTNYLGYEVPIILDKEVDKYIVIGHGHYANHARVIYKDNSVFNMEKGILDPSGIYGASLVSKETIGGVKVTINKYENTMYATWTYKNYSYSYAMKDVDENTLNIEVNKVLEIIK